MKAFTPILMWRQSAARLLGSFMTMFCLASISSTHLSATGSYPAPGALDPTFERHIHERARIGAILTQPDGRLVVGGGFRIPGVGTNLVRFTRDGAPDPSFAPTSGVPWYVAKLAMQPDGKLLVGNKGGIDGLYPAIGLSRFLPDGSLDSSFWFRMPPDLGRGEWSGFWTKALAVQSDGRILVAGHYERDHFDYWYWAALSFQRLLPDGSEGEFFSFTWPGPRNIGVLMVLPDQRILVAGDILARLNPDGSEDAGFVRTVLTAGEINCCVTQADGKILVGGSFTNLQGHARCRIARVMPDGQLDLSFTPPVSTRDYRPHETAVHAIAVQPDGRILVGGDFEMMNGLPYVALARLNSDGSLDTSFPAVLRLNEDQDIVTVNNLLIQDGDRVITGGGGEEADTTGYGLFRIHLGEPALRLAIEHVPSGTFQLSFNYSGSGDFTVLTTTNLGLSDADWTVLGSATNDGAGLYQFTDRVPTSETHRFTPS